MESLFSSVRRCFCACVVALLLQRADAEVARVGVVDACGAPSIVRVASTAAERYRGIQDRSDLGTADGMAFVYASPTIPAFWMVDTSIPLEIVFLAPSGRVLASQSMLPNTRIRHTAPGPVTVVLEFPTATFHRTHLPVGTYCRVLLPTR